MSSNSFLLEARKRIGEKQWYWIVLSLWQDPIIWGIVTESGLGRKALERFGDEIGNWSPASLFFLEINRHDVFIKLKSPHFLKVDQSLRSRADEAYQTWNSGKDRKLTLEFFGFVALSIRERLGEMDSWNEVLADIESNESFGTVLAILYGMVPNPQVLISSLVSSQGRQVEIEFALQTILCQPDHPSNFEASFNRLFIELPDHVVVKALRWLTAHRPWLAEKIASERLGEPSNKKFSAWPGLLEGEMPVAFFPAEDKLDDLSAQIYESNLLDITGRSKETINALKQSVKTSGAIRANLAARLGREIFQNKIPKDEIDLDLGVEFWKKATQIEPENPYFVSGLALALFRAGRLDDAKTFLAIRQGVKDPPPHPVYSLTRAIMAFYSGQWEKARQEANQTYEFLVIGKALDQEGVETLAYLLYETGSYPRAADVVWKGLQRSRASLRLIVLEIQSLLATGNPTGALAASLIGKAIEGAYEEMLGDNWKNSPFSTLFIHCLEEEGEWPWALKERQGLMSNKYTPSIDELIPIAVCEMQAGNPERAEQLCLQAMDIDAEDGRVYGLFGDLNELSGDLPQAISNYEKAVLQDPQLIEYWIKLGRMHGISGENEKLVKILRAAGHANPDSPEIHKTLGEAYLKGNAQTNALESLWRAYNAAFIERGPESVNKTRYSVSLEPVSSKMAELKLRIALLLGKTLSDLGYQGDALMVYKQSYGSLVKPGSQTPGHKNGNNSLLILANDLAFDYSKALLQDGDLETAVEVLDWITKSGSEYPEHHLFLARALLKINDPSSNSKRTLEAINSYEKLAKVSHDDNPTNLKLVETAESQILRAEALASMGDDLGSREIYRKVMNSPIAKDEGYRARLNVGLGRVAVNLGEPQMAVAAFQEAMDAAPKDTGIRRELSQAYLLANLIEDSITESEKVIAENPEDINSLIWYSRHMMRLKDKAGGLDNGYINKVLEKLEKASVQYPSRTDLLISLGEVQIASAEFESARITYRNILNDSAFIQEASTSELSRIVKGLQEIGDKENADQILEAVQAKSKNGISEIESPDPAGTVDILNEMVSMREYSDDRDRTRQTIEGAIQNDPSNFRLYLKKIALLQSIEKNDEALEFIERTIEVFPSNLDLHRQAAMIHYEDGHLLKALHHAALAIPKESNAEWTADDLEICIFAAELARGIMQPRSAWSLLGRDYPQSGRVENQFKLACVQAELAIELGLLAEAKEASDRANDNSLKYPRSVAIHARLCRRDGDYQKGESLIKIALQGIHDEIRSHPDSSQNSHEVPDGHDYRSLGAAALEFSKWDEAVFMLRSAAEQLPKEPLSHYLLAESIVIRAEAKNLCNELQVINHAPGHDAFSGDVSREFEKSLNVAETLIGGFYRDEDVSLQIESEDVLYKLNLMRSRGRAAFAQNVSSVNNYQELIQTQKSDSEWLAAYILTATTAGLTDQVLSLFVEKTNPQLELESLPDNPILAACLAITAKRKNPRQALHLSISALEEGVGKTSLHIVSTPMLYFTAATSAAACDEYVVAREMVERALSAWPDEPLWNEFAVELYLNEVESAGLPDFEAAVKYLEKLIQLDPQKSSHYLTLGNIHFDKNNFSLALPILKKAVELAPKQEEPRFLLAKAQLGAGLLEIAQESAKKSAELASDSYNSNHLRTQIALESGDLQLATELAESLIETRPNEPHAYRLLSQALNNMGRMDEALTVLENVPPSSQHSVPILIERVRLMRSTKGINEALNELQRLIENNPDRPQLLALQAEMKMEVGEIDAAVLIAQQALLFGRDSLQSDDCSTLHTIIGREMKRTGQLDRAIDHLSQAVQDNPDISDKYLDLGDVFTQRRQYQEAYAAYRKAIDLSPKDFRPYYHAGLILKESKDYLKAEEMLSHAKQLAPADENIRRLYGAVVAINLVHNRGSEIIQAQTQ